MSSYESFDQQIDCRGMMCPAPILKTAKAARALKGQDAILQILADDQAFPEDIKSWCKSSNATLLKLEQRGDVFQAQVRVAQGAAQTAAPAAIAQPSTAATAAPQAELIDCRGLQCPAPILKIAKAARTMPSDHLFEVLADDDAFPEDIKSWCSSANATLLEINRKDGAHRALILRSSQPPAQQSVAKAAPASAPAPFAREVSRPVEALRSTMPALPSNQPPSSAIPALRVALRDLSPEAAAARLDAVVHAYEPGEQIALESNDPTFAAVFMRWCAERNHTLLQLDTRANPARAELIMGAHNTALVATSSAALVPAVATRKRCTLLILHSDFEALMAALLVANGAAAQGMEVTIFFSFWGLNLLRGESIEAELAASKRGWFGNLIARLTGSRRPKSSTTRVTLPQRMFKMMMPSGPRAQALGKLNFAGMGSSMLQQIMRDQKIMSLPEMLSSAIEQDVRFMICTMSMGVMGITREDLMPLPNIVYGGVASFVEDAGRADVSLVF